MRVPFHTLDMGDQKVLSLTEAFDTFPNDVQAAGISILEQETVHPHNSMNCIRIIA